MTPEENKRIADLETAVLMLIKMHHMHAINHAGISGNLLSLIDLHFAQNRLQAELWKAGVSMIPNSDDDLAQKISRLLKNAEFNADQFKTSFRNATDTLNGQTVKFNAQIKTFTGLLAQLDPLPMVVVPADWSFPQTPDSPAAVQ